MLMLLAVDGRGSIKYLLVPSQVTLGRLPL